jgi:hypothetical protein
LDRAILALLIGRAVGGEQLAIFASVERNDNDQLWRLLSWQNVIRY